MHQRSADVYDGTFHDDDLETAILHQFKQTGLLILDDLLNDLHLRTTAAVSHRS